VVPDAQVPVRFSVSGAGELAATGTTAPDDAVSFRAPLRKTYQGRCVAILRPMAESGKITLKAEADGLQAAMITVQTK
jgi:beta-galactosidase